MEIEIISYIVITLYIVYIIYLFYNPTFSPGFSKRSWKKDHVDFIYLRFQFRI